MASDKPWRFSESDYTPEQYKRACLIDTGEGDPDSKSRYHLPVREPGGALNRNGVHAAAQRIGQVKASPEKKAAAVRKLISLYNELGEDPPDSLRSAAGGGQRGSAELVGSVEYRAANINAVNLQERILTVLAVPYEPSSAQVEYRGQIWNEVFTRGAFKGLDGQSRRIPVTVVLQPNEDGSHTGGHLVGKVAAAHPDRADGLLLDLKISETERGNETLALAADDAVSPSVGFAIRPSDQKLYPATMTRRISRAFLDHLSLVSQPAYADARVLSMRGAATPQLVSTPNLDALAHDPILNWAADRLAPADSSADPPG